MSSDTTAKLATANDLSKLGVQPADAERMFAMLRHTRLAVIELDPTERTENAADDGHDSVKLRVIAIQVAPDGSRVAEFLRDLMAALHRQASPAPLDGELGQESVDEAVARGAAYLEPEPAMAP